MRSPTKLWYFAISVFFFLTACTTGFHGSFAPNTYIGEEDGATSARIGSVKGQSCQTRVLYLFPAGPAPSTAEAIQSAKHQHEDTKFLTDISISQPWRVRLTNICLP